MIPENIPNFDIYTFVQITEMVNILIGATGSVATIKLPILVETLKKHENVNVKVVLTEAAHFFVKNDKIDCDVYRESDEWNAWKKRNDPVLHIELRNWADIMLVAPLDANTLAKLANGLCDNLLTCVLRAWDSSKPVIVCPAMNTHMWNHKFTAKHLDFLKEELNFTIIQPISKKLACGDIGIGAMEEVTTISNFVMDFIGKSANIAGLKVVV